MNHLRRVQERRSRLWAEAARNRWDFGHSPAAGLGWLPKGCTRERTQERKRRDWGALLIIAATAILVAAIAIGIIVAKIEAKSEMGGCGAGRQKSPATTEESPLPVRFMPTVDAGCLVTRRESGQPPISLQAVAPASSDSPGEADGPAGAKAGTCFGVEPPPVSGDGPGGLRLERILKAPNAAPQDGVGSWTGAEEGSGRGSNAECTKRPTGRCGSPPGAEPLPVGNPADRYPPLSAAERTAIEQVESGGDPAAWKKDEDARGIIQIRPIYVADANRILLRQGSGGQGPRRKPFTHDDAFDPAKAWEMFDVVTSYYIRAHGYADTFEVRARIHNGGGKGPTKQGTLGYWRKVQAAL